MKFVLTYDKENAFNKLKRLLQNSPILSFRRYDLDFRLAVDTSCH